MLLAAVEIAPDNTPNALINFPITINAGPNIVTIPPNTIIAFLASGLKS